MQLWSLNPRFYNIQDTSIKSKSRTYVKSIAPDRQTFAHVFSVWMLWDDALRCELCWIWARGCCCCWWCCRARAALAHSSSKLAVYSKWVSTKPKSTRIKLYYSSTLVLCRWNEIAWVHGDCVRYRMEGGTNLTSKDQPVRFLYAAQFHLRYCRLNLFQWLGNQIRLNLFIY